MHDNNNIGTHLHLSSNGHPHTLNENEHQVPQKHKQINPTQFHNDIMKVYKFWIKNHYVFAIWSGIFFNWNVLKKSIHEKILLIQHCKISWYYFQPFLQSMLKPLNNIYNLPHTRSLSWLSLIYDHLNSTNSRKLPLVSGFVRWCWRLCPAVDLILSRMRSTGLLHLYMWWSIKYYRVYSLNIMPQHYAEGRKPLT